VSVARINLLLILLLLIRGCLNSKCRCFARGPLNATEPVQFPESMWTSPQDGNINWEAYQCKSFECLNSRAAKKVFADCLDCFDLSGREKNRWMIAPGGVDFTIEEVLALKPRIRIGLDIGGGTASFAVRMREHNVTIVTSTLNLGGPFNNFIAQRGVMPIFMSISQRLPFWDNTLDLVHSMHVLSNWIPDESLEFILFDIDRVLRPGGILWLDHFFCVRSQLENTYIPMITRLGYKELKWEVGKKLDRGEKLQEVYLSALLEKPHAARL
jgi:SAM-dependent methyltransferase